jgi:hypothetical protein
VAFSLFIRFNTAHGPGHTRVWACWIDQQAAKLTVPLCENEEFYHQTDPIEMTVIDRALLCAVDLTRYTVLATCTCSTALGSTDPLPGPLGYDRRRTAGPDPQWLDGCW